MIHLNFKFSQKIKLFFSPLGVGGWLFIANCLLPTANCFSQSEIIKYARTIIDTLAAPGMHGRGYVNKGDSIAADYLKKEFEKIGVRPIAKSFEQRFNFNVNTVSDDGYNRLLISNENILLLPGRDFLISSSSCGMTYKYSDYLLPIWWMDSATYCNKKKLTKFVRKSRGTYIMVDLDKIREEEVITSFRRNKTPELLIFLKRKKLTWDVSQRVDKIPSIQLFVGDSINKIKKLFAGRELSGHTHISNSFLTNHQSQNILGYIKGTQYPDSFIVFSAHYDHLGRMGKDVYFPGANDNASGCAMLLSLAKYYAGHPPKYSVAFMAFGAEEVGLLGSKHYVAKPLFPLKQIKFLVNMDIMGTGDEGIKVVNATEHKKEFDALVKINDEKKLLPSIQPRGKAKNSDHYYFEEAGVKTFFIYTLGGIKAYHDIYDRAETLPLTKFEETFKLLMEFVNTF